MQFSWIAPSLALILNTASAAELVRQTNLKPRDDVSNCKAALFELKASKFCYSLVPITDSTPTVTKTGPSSSTTVTVPSPPCLVTAPASTTTRTSTSTSTSTSTTTTTVTVMAGMKKRATSPTKCSAKGVLTAVQSFACAVITSACKRYVTPGTTTTTTLVLGKTFTQTITTPVPCATTTPIITTITTSTTTTATTTTTTTTTTVQPTCTNGLLTENNYCSCSYNIYCDTGISQDADASGSATDYKACANQCDSFTNCGYFAFASVACNIYAAGDNPPTSAQSGSVVGTRNSGSCGSSTGCYA